MTGKEKIMWLWIVIIILVIVLASSYIIRSFFNKDDTKVPKDMYNLCQSSLERTQSDLGKANEEVDILKSNKTLLENKSVECLNDLKKSQEKIIELNNSIKELKGDLLIYQNRITNIKQILEQKTYLILNIILVLGFAFTVGLELFKDNIFVKALQAGISAYFVCTFLLITIAILDNKIPDYTSIINTSIIVAVVVGIVSLIGYLLRK